MKNLSLLLFLGLVDHGIAQAMDVSTADRGSGQEVVDTPSPDLASYQQKLFNDLLIDAVKAGNLARVQLLLGKGANPRVKDKSGKELRTIASDMGRGDIFAALKANIPESAQASSYLGLLPRELNKRILAQYLIDHALGQPNPEEYLHRVLLTTSDDLFVHFWNALELFGNKNQIIIEFLQNNPRKYLKSKKELFTDKGSITQKGLMLEKRFLKKLIENIDPADSSITDQQLKNFYQNLINLNKPGLVSDLLDKFGNRNNVLGTMGPRLAPGLPVDPSQFVAIFNRATKNPNMWLKILFKTLNISPRLISLLQPEVYLGLPLNPQIVPSQLEKLRKDVETFPSLLPKDVIGMIDEFSINQEIDNALNQAYPSAPTTPLASAPVPNWAPLVKLIEQAVIQGNKGQLQRVIEAWRRKIG